SLAALHNLAKEVKDELQAGLGPDEATILKAAKPLDNLLDRGSQVKMGLVRALGIIPSQPTTGVARPFVKVLQRRTGRRLLPQALLEVKEKVVEPGDQFLLSHRSHIVFDETPVEKRDHKRSVIRSEQPPGRMIAPQADEVVVFHGDRVQ